MRTYPAVSSSWLILILISHKYDQTFLFLFSKLALEPAPAYAINALERLHLMWLKHLYYTLNVILDQEYVYLEA